MKNKTDGSYRIRGVKEGFTARFALDGQNWKPFIAAQVKPEKINDKVFYAAHLTPKTQIKSVQTIEVIETFVSRGHVSNQVIAHLHEGFDVQFKSHPNAIKKNQTVQLKLFDQHKALAGVGAKILVQTTDFAREGKVLQSLKSNEKGELNFKLAEQGQYLLYIDYQQAFEQKSEQLKRYKYTLAFNVIH